MDDHIAVKIDGVIYVKLEDVKPMRYRIDELEAALRNIYDKWENGVGICDVIDAMDAAHAALGEKKDG
jgi:hypothetical protein